MLVSTRGRYALRVLIDLAENGGDNYIPLKDISERQDISKKYLESIMSLLSKGGLVDAAPGKSGGYRLNREASEYTAGEVLRLTEGNLAPVNCVGEGATCCERAAGCKTLPLWNELNDVVNDFLDGVTLDRLAGREGEV